MTFNEQVKFYFPKRVTPGMRRKAHKDGLKALQTIIKEHLG
jgi:hypothetical protein